MIRDPERHCRRDPQSLMVAAEILARDAERDRGVAFSNHSAKKENLWGGAGGANLLSTFRSWRCSAKSRSRKNRRPGPQRMREFRAFAADFSSISDPNKIRWSRAPRSGRRRPRLLIMASSKTITSKLKKP